MKEKKGLLGVFAYLDDLLGAIRAVREKGLKIEAVYSPTRRDEVTEALGLKPSPVRYFALIGGALGIATGFGLSIFTAVQWRFIVSGKPPVPTVPYVIEGFEFCILLGVVLNLLGVALNARLPKLRLPKHYDPRFSEDRFGVVVLCRESERETVKMILSDAGAEEIHDAHP